MKKRNLFIATLLVVAAAAVAFVSCKKENQNALLNNNQPVEAFKVPQIDDMNAYLKGFKQRMEESQNAKDAEYLSLEEAAWHLSSLANYDFARVNVRFTDLRYDTLYYQVNVTNGQIALSDLNTVYASMANDIDAFYQSLDLQEKHFRFIGASISEDGQVRATLITSYIMDHTWYFDDDYLAALACYDLFDQDSSYIWNDEAIEELRQAINLLESRNYIMPDEVPTSKVYYVYTMEQDFNYQDNIDPYGSPFYMNSRIYVAIGDTYSNPSLDYDAMCYCLDSYLELPFEYLNTNPGFGNQRPVHWDIDWRYFKSPDDRWHIFCHIVHVTFARVVVSNDNPNQY